MTHSDSSSMNPASNNLNRRGSSGPDESTLLLHDDEEHGRDGSMSAQEMSRTPLPKAQLGALVVVRIVDPIAYMQIFPYINQRLADLRIAPPEQVGFYSGFIESAYSLAQMFSVYHWGRLSDIIGRRPVVIFTLVGIAVTTIAFGLSESLVTLLASRFIGGLVAGNIAVVHSILVEITDETNQNIAVPLYSLSWSTGSIVGSLIGGTFANAATRYPKYFSWPIFLNHPYLPPCVISAVCALLGTGLGYLFIKETLPKKRKDLSLAPGRSCSSTSDIDSDPAETGYTSLKALLAIPTLRALTLSGFAISFLASAFDVLFTLFCYTPLDAGGLGLQPSVIGSFLAFAGTFAVLLRLVAMPYILRRFDYATIYSRCTYLWPLVFAFLPVLNALARILPPAHSEMSLRTFGITRIDGVAIWISLALVLTVSRVAAIPFSIIMLLIKRHASAPYAPTTSVGNSGIEYDTCSDSRSKSAPGSVPVIETGKGPALGQCNGLVQLAMSFGRALGPVVASTLFTALNGSAWVKRWGIGWVWSLVMVCFAVVGVRSARDIR